MGSAASASPRSPSPIGFHGKFQEESFNEAAELAFRRVDPEVSRLPERSWTLAPQSGELWIYQRVKAYDADGWARRFGRSTGGVAGVAFGLGLDKQAPVAGSCSICWQFCSAVHLFRV